MRSLESIVKKGVFFGGLVSGMSCNHNGQDTNTLEDTGVIDTGEQYECQPAQITSELTATAYVNEEFSYTLTVERDSHSSCDVENYYSICDFPNPPVEISDDSGVNGCTMTWTPTQSDYQQTFLFNLKAKDWFGIDEDVLEVYVDWLPDELTLNNLTDLSGYTNATVTGSGTATGEPRTASITVDSTLESVVSSTDATITDNTVNYSVTFNNAVDWLTYTTGEITGTAIIEVCDIKNDCVNETVNVTSYAPTQVLITVQTPDDKDKLINAYVTLDCVDGDSFTGLTDSNGEVNAYLNYSINECTITADDNLNPTTHATYNYEHTFTSGSEDEVSSGYYEVWAEIYYNDPTIYDPDTTSEDCFGGNIETMWDLLAYANSMIHQTGGDSGRRDFERYSEGELSEIIKYWVMNVNQYGEEISDELYQSMYNAVVEGTERINNENPLGYTFFEEAGTIDDANILFKWSTSGTSVGCGSNSNYIIEDYSSGEYCMIFLHTASSRTVMEEVFNTLSRDLDYCGDSISDGWTSFTTIDWALWNTIHFANYQNMMERTY